MVVAMVALFAALGGTSYAVISSSTVPDSLGVFHACVNRSSGGTRIVTKPSACQKAVAHGKHKTLGELAVAWSQTGPAGKSGSNGTNGTNGAPGTPAVFNRTRLNWNEGTPSTSSATFVSLRSLGTVSKQQASTVLRITVQTDVFQVGGPGFCVYQVRVDGKNDGGSSDATIAAGSTGTEAVVGSAGNAVPVTIVAVFGGLAAGSHTLAIYAADSAATSCIEDSGGFSHSAFVEEIT
jgi:hypothetical protein